MTPEAIVAIISVVVIIVGGGVSLLFGCLAWLANDIRKHDVSRIEALENNYAKIDNKIDDIKTDVAVIKKNIEMLSNNIDRIEEENRC